MKKKSLKLFICILLCGMLLLSSFSYSVLAEESPKILRFFLGREAQNPEATLIRNDETGSLTISSSFMGHIWGMYTTPDELGVKEDDVIKIAMVVKINSVDGEEGMVKSNPLFDLGDGDFFEYGADYQISELADYVGETVILVGCHSVPECQKIEARMWHSSGCELELLEVVIASNGYNFEGYKGYSVLEERYDTVNYDANAEENLETELEPSWKDPNATPIVTETPTQAPTEAPTEVPTEAPTEAPTQDPTEAPAEEPTEAPTSTNGGDTTPAPQENNLLVFILGGVVIVLVVVFLVIVLIKKRK